VDQILMACSNEALSILAALSTKHNVLLSGPPSCGKTHLLQEVADTFAAPAVQPARPAQPMAVAQRVAIPAQIAAPVQQVQGLPSPSRVNRHIERIAFSANTRARDFTTAFVPSVNGGAAGFQVAKGALIRANEAALNGSAALLIIDEMNRGPAVQLFGDAIVSIEQDKRLDPSDQSTKNTWPLHILNDQGRDIEMRLSSHLYILAALNQADVSIEPLDVAFLRRFEPMPLEPRSDVVRSALKASGNTPDAPAVSGDVVEIAVRAWDRVNERIALGRGPDFRIGHGIFLLPNSPPANVAEALDRAVGWWKRIAAHVQEVFFGDLIGAGIVFNEGQSGTGYKIVSTPYGVDQKQQLIAPTINAGTIYAVLRQVAGA
jgi:5-methylcytosine-specific restriction protein B